MLDSLALSSLEQVRAIADPLRLRMIEALIPAELTIGRLAVAVGVPSSRLYHHVDLLVAAGLVEVSGQLKRRGGDERLFRATARRYQLDQNLLAMSPGPQASVTVVLDLARSVLGGALESLTEGLHSGRIKPGQRGRGALLEERTVILGPDGLEALGRELSIWLDDFARRHRAARGTPYQLAFAAFPASPPAAASRRDASTRRRGSRTAR